MSLNTIADYYAYAILQKRYQLGDKGEQFDRADIAPILIEMIENVFKETLATAAEVAADISGNTATAAAIQSITLPEVLERI